MVERKNRVVLVTGASSGIGAAIARRFAATGHDVLATGRNRKGLEVLSTDFPNIVVLEANLDSAAECARVVAQCARQFSGIDVLINNAGIYFRRNTESTSDDEWRQTLAVNLEAPFYLSRAALPYLRKRGGCIINIASDWGIHAGRDSVAYCASKGGLVLMTRAMALDHAAEGIRVNAICPGDVDTPMLEQEAAVDGLSHHEALQRYGRQSPTGRVTNCDEVAALALFLASEEAAQITGAAIPIDGGNTA